MANMFDYLTWRGDLSLTQSPFQDVDSLILSTMSYIFFDGVVAESMEERITIGEMVDKFLARPQTEWKLRVQEDERLLRALKESDRFIGMEMCGYVNKLDFQTEKQFAALTILLGDGTAFVVYRGTDYSLVGWKENFNMCFMDDVPAQQDAAAYLTHVATAFPELELRVSGHSKGGNLAVYAAAMCPREVQERIRVVYNHDGPGFRETVLGREGYQNILPRMKTFLPQFSVVGLLLEQQGEGIVVRSNESGIMQHEPYSWEMIGSDFVKQKGLTEKSYFLDSTMSRWMEGLTEKQRELFINSIYEAVATAPIDDFGEAAISPKMIIQTLQALHAEDEGSKIISSGLRMLVDAARKTADEFAGRTRMDEGERRNQNEK
ncbi:MAG: DUF2974 domain-containing protein [Anaerotignum sp.]|nr:DUF2974 domain-containing protein [Anaerotignum sp.]